MKNNLLKELEEKIQQGENKNLQIFLNDIDRKKLSRDELIKLANLARRAGFAHYAIIALAPFFRESNPLPPTELEILEYAASLIRLGLIQEAKRHLNPIESPTQARWHLYQAFVLFSSWDYEKALPFLENYLNILEPDEYAHYVGVINLISTLIFLKDYDSALEHIQLLKPILLKHHYQLLLGNIYELESQIYIHQKKWSHAEKTLHQSLHYLKQNQNLNRLFVQKWMCILKMGKENYYQQKIKYANQFKINANKLKHWESIRMIDYFTAHFCQDERLLTHVYYATPYPSLKTKFMQENTDLYIPNQYLLKKDHHQGVLDLVSGSINNQELFKTGQLMHRLLQSMFRDLYGKNTTAQLFNLIYPEERYNPLSSPIKVYQLIKRFNQFCEKKQIYMKIRASNKYYEIESNYQIQLKDHGHHQIINQPDYILNQIPYKEFNSQDIAITFKLNKRKSQRIIKELLLTNKIKKLRKGRNIYYIKKIAS